MQCAPGHYMIDDAVSKRLPKDEQSVNLECTVPPNAAIGTAPLLQLDETSGVMPFCNKSTCGTVPNPVGSTITYGGYMIGDEATVVCNPEYMSNVAGRTRVSKLKCLPKDLTATVDSPPSVWRDAALNQVTAPCLPTACPTPQDPLGIWVQEGGEGINAFWILQCPAELNAFVTNGSSLARCTENGDAVKVAYCKKGGCTASQLQDRIKLNVNGTIGTDCVSEAGEKQFCTLICGTGYTVMGQWTCLQGEYVGEPKCVKGNVATDNVTMLLGKFKFTASPVGLAPLPPVESEDFKNDIRDVLSETLQVESDHWLKFDIEASSSFRRLQQQNVGSPSGLTTTTTTTTAMTTTTTTLVEAQPDRRLQRASVGADVSYQLRIYDTGQTNNLMVSLNALQLDSTEVAQTFKQLLREKDYRVTSVEVLVSPIVFNDILEAEEQVEEEDDLAGGVGALILLAAIPVCCCCCCFFFLLRRGKSSG
eukprot:gnl/TRDRNA2_/TRDRNA2_168565_c1_seq1.p1 gnl/TRDRNA2_/TRDRNA2_168565_c1~~gnl/TRDRNA2_/TRDRNA2_168565_c1_seq1.p1  ORF type:complete len:496 (-),score=64.02 gnl/TRDRNA2_/TRDRNA2_168565_c1_seq1:77-1510(-)